MPKVLGMICGVGSMMIGAKRQGWDIVGNIEWRPYYHTGTFEANFPGAFMVKTLKDLSAQQRASCEHLDLIIGHTECGGYSNLRVDKRKAIDAGSMGDIPQFVEAVQELKPKFFAMDNLPKALMVADWRYWAEALPDYEITFEWVSNFNYGNVQKNRNRLFVIGARRELGYNFIPGEQENTETLGERLSKISPEAPNRDPLDLDEVYGGWSKYHFDPLYIDLSPQQNRLTLRELQDYIRPFKPHQVLPYYNKKGELKSRIGYMKVKRSSYALVLSGGGGCFDNHFLDDTLMPFTIRERAKIQGCPDDFIFLPEHITRTCKEYSHLIKQTGKFMPVEFCTYLTGQIRDFLDLAPMEAYSGKRFLKPNEYIDQAKVGYCMGARLRGYTNHHPRCQACGSKAACIKTCEDDLM